MSTEHRGAKEARVYGFGESLARGFGAGYLAAQVGLTAWLAWWVGRQFLGESSAGSSEADYSHAIGAVCGAIGVLGVVVHGARSIARTSRMWPFAVLAGALAGGAATFALVAGRWSTLVNTVPALRFDGWLFVFWMVLGWAVAASLFAPRSWPWRAFCLLIGGALAGIQWVLFALTGEDNWTLAGLVVPLSVLASTIGFYAVAFALGARRHREPAAAEAKPAEGQ